MIAVKLILPPNRGAIDAICKRLLEAGGEIYQRQLNNDPAQANEVVAVIYPTEYHAFARALVEGSDAIADNGSVSMLIDAPGMAMVQLATVGTLEERVEATVRVLESARSMTTDEDLETRAGMYTAYWHRRQ